VTTRSRFVARMTELLTDAGVGHVVLHAQGDDAYLDSDVDIAVDRRDVALVDTLLHSGALGRLVQRIHHDVPWCRYYVLATGDPERRYRQVDVASDPWGLSALGRSIDLALASGRLASETRPRPAEEELFLLAKRAHKGLRGEDDRAALVEGYRRDPEGARRLLESELDGTGSRLADELDRGSISWAALEELWRSMSRTRRRPATAARRVAYSTGRLVERLRHPTGLSVVIAGPDGTGKSELADALPTACAGAFWGARRMHLNPSVLPPPGRLLRRAPRDPTTPHAQPTSALVSSLARLGYLWLDALIAWGPQVALPRRRSILVVVERGWRDLEVDPTRYRIVVPRSVTRALGRLLPRPDLVLVLAAPADVVAARKAELEPAELKRQLQEWKRIAASDPERYVELDTSKPLDEVRAAAVAAIEERLAARYDDLRPVDLALQALGGMQKGGQPHRIISIRRQARWVLPDGCRAPGPIGTHLYRPFRPRHAVGAFALELGHRAGWPLMGRRAPLSVERGLAGAIAEQLGEHEVTLAAVTTGDRDRGRRAVLAVSSGGRLRAFAKVALEERESLLRERDVLALLSRLDLHKLLPPHILGCFEWQGCVVLLLEPLQLTSYADRALGDAELAALAELGRLGDALAPILGQDGTRSPIHGDFAPWNSGVVKDGRLAVWDWEEARLGRPLEDVFHWRIQRHLRGADVSLAEIVGDALGPGPMTATAADRLGVASESAPEALRQYLDETLGRPPRINYPGVAALRREALGMLVAPW
jgi:hypothetical protein